MDEYLTLVDENDQPCGKMEKLKVHQLGLLHRAFSVFIFNTKGELLLQQRADNKYHSGGLWTNSCCSHPQFGEKLSSAIERRLKEEIGIHCHTYFAFNFIYKTEFPNGLTEHEFDHVYFGVSNDKPFPTACEVKNWKYISLQHLELDILSQPENYTEWLKICMPKAIKYFQETFKSKLLEYAPI